MKKFLSSLLAIMMFFSLTACDNAEKESSSEISSESNTESSGTESVSPEDDITARVLAMYPDAEITKIVKKDDGSISATYNVGDLTEVMTVYAGGGVGTAPPDLLEENFPSYEEVQAQYPDKTVLVWVIDDTMYEHFAPFPTAELNEYLDKNGYDIAVCFKPVYEDSDMHFPDPMLIEIKKLLDAGERIDIISPMMNYSSYVYDGMYEPLDEYLETDIGRGLCQTLPEKFLESLRINGSIYGLSGDVNFALSPDRGYYVNAELAEKYGYDVNKPILEQLDILKAVKENEKKTDVFSTYVSLDSIVKFENVRMLSSAVYWNDDTHSAALSIDNPNYIEKMRALDTIKKEGFLHNMSAGTSDSFFIMADSVCGGGAAYADMKPVEVDYSIEYAENYVTAIPVFPVKTMVRNESWVTGIYSGSENKDEAFELLAKIHTDPDLNNLMVYGVEGENYTLENGFVKEIENPNGANVNPFNTYRFANLMICHRSTENPFTPEQYTEMYENAEVYGDIDFVPDPTNILSELNAEYIAADNISLPKKDENLDDLLAEYREGLYAAGVQKIIDECNKQYEKYKEEKDEKIS